MLWTIFVYFAVYFGLFTGIFFMFTFFENLDRVKFKVPKRFPKVTVIVPAYNEETTISGTLYSLLSLDYPKDKLEIICVDDGSKDNTYSIAKKFIEKGVRVFTKENSGKADSLNFALSKSSGELVGCLDADSFVMSDALMKMVAHFEDERIMAVTPSIKVWKDTCLLQKMQKIEYMMGVFLRKVFAYLDSIHVTPGPFTIYRKSFFDKYGGYDVGNLTEDIEVALRIQKNGFRIENVMDANVYTVGPNKFKALLRQRNRWYVGFLNNVINYRDLFSLRQGNLGVLILPSAFISVALSIILFIYASMKFITHSINDFANFASIHFDFIPLLSDPFSKTIFVDFNPLRLLAFFSLLMGLAMLLISKKYSNEESRVKFSYLLYLAIYWVFFAFWWMVAISIKLFKKRISW